MLFILKTIVLIQICSANLIYKLKGDLNIGLLIKECEETTAVSKTLINSAIWTTDRLNNIRFTGLTDVGISVFNVCHSDDYYNSIFKLFQDRNDEYLLGFIAVDNLPEKIDDFVRVLDVSVKKATRFLIHLLKASVKLLNELDWVQEITIVAPNQSILREFYRLTRREWMCVENFVIFDKHSNSIESINWNNPVIIFGDVTDVKIFFLKYNVSSQTEEDSRIIIVPLDGSVISGIPDGAYIIQPPYSDLSTQPKPTLQKIIPTPLMFEIANPILSYTKSISNFIDENCNETAYKLNCIRNHWVVPKNYEILQPITILKILKLEPLSNEFVYNIYRVENLTTSKQETNLSDFEYLRTTVLQNYIKTYTYNIIDDNLTYLLNEVNFTNKSEHDCEKSFEKCILECVNFKSIELTKVFEISRNINVRPEPWLYAFISISLLGVIFCIAILIFIIVKLCKRRMLEGNPILTICLLIAVLVMFASITPFAIEGNKELRHNIYLARALCVTLPYACVFGLLLSRTILLANISKEVGFMSHIAGSVQAFLTLFIFGVQCALSIQVIRNSDDIFRGNLLVYLLSYNVILLIFLIFLTPLITKSQRNYREGKYFTISVMLIACSWSCWLPAYSVLEDEWKDPMLCLGLVSTASIVLGSIFIPRTYLMTVSAARERFTSALPSLATATSAMDIYRASTQPVYDCVNVTAINANVSRSTGGALPLPHPDLYTCPSMPPDDHDDEDEFEIEHCDTPPPDKVTRF